MFIHNLILKPAKINVSFWLTRLSSVDFYRRNCNPKTRTNFKIASVLWFNDTHGRKSSLAHVSELKHSRKRTCKAITKSSGYSCLAFARNPASEVVSKIILKTSPAASCNNLFSKRLPSFRA